MLIPGRKSALAAEPAGQRAGAGAGVPAIAADATELDPFAVAEQEFKALRSARAQGLVDAREFRRRVAALMVTDAEGTQWIPSPQDGAWHRRDGAAWVPGLPLRRLLCPRCGHHNLTRHQFCVECGAKMYSG